MPRRALLPGLPPLPMFLMDSRVYNSEGARRYADLFYLPDFQTYEQAVRWLAPEGQPINDPDDISDDAIVTLAGLKVCQYFERAEVDSC